MADLKIEDATPDTDVTGAELLPASDGGMAKCISVEKVKDFVLAQISALSNAGTMDISQNAVYLKQGAALTPIGAQDFANAILNYAFGLAGAASLTGNEVFVIKNGSTLQTVTLSNLKAWVEDNLAHTQIASLDAAGALADADLAMVSQSGTDKKATLAVLRTYCLAGLYASAVTSTSALAADDYIFVYRNSQLEKVKKSDAGLADGNVKTAVTTTAYAIPQWSSTDKTLTAGLALTDEVVATPQGATKIPTEAAVRAALTALQTLLQAAINGKQATLSFDTTPRSGSSNPVTSDGVYAQCYGLQASLTSHTGDSTIHVTAADKENWNGKQDELTFDTSPTSGSSNPVTSGALYTALAAKTGKIVTVSGIIPYNSRPEWTGYAQGALVTATYESNSAGTTYEVGLFLNLGDATYPMWYFVATLVQSTPAEA